MGMTPISLLRLLAVALLGLGSAYAEKVPNPEYKYWAGHKPGSTVTIIKDQTIITPKEESKKGKEEVNKVQTWVVWTIEKVTPEGVQISGKSGVGAMKAGADPGGFKQTETIAANIDSAMVNKLEEMGTEKITVKAGTFECRKTKRVVTQEILGTKVVTTVITWWSDKVPGGVVRTTLENGDKTSSAVRHVTAFKSAK